MGPDANDDADLLVRAQAGDRAAFGILVQRHMRRAASVAASLVGNREQALDLSQEAFSRAFQRLQDLDPARPFFPWLYRVLSRLCLNHLRDRRGKGEGADMDAFVAAGAEDPSDQADRAEQRERCQAALNTLPPREREALMLRTYQGLSYQEIADLVEIPIGTVMSRLYSARRRLAVALGEVS